MNVVDAGFPADISDVELIELAGLLYIIVYCINAWNNIVEYVFLRVCNLAMQFVLSMGWGSTVVVFCQTTWTFLDEAAQDRTESDTQPTMNSQ